MKKNGELTQQERVEKRLLTTGQISRNECLRQFPAITRLGAIICDMTKTGWSFETKYINKDYVYKIVKCPLRKIVYKIGEREIITYKK